VIGTAIDMHRVKWFKKAAGACLRGVLVGTKTTGFGIEALIVRTEVSCSCFSDEETLRSSGVAQTTASPGDLVGFALTGRGWRDFEKQGIGVGDMVELSIHGERARDLSGSGRQAFDESLIKLKFPSPPARVEAAPLPKSRVGWPRIVALASDAYSSTAADGFREKALLLAAAVIDLESSQNLSDLISKAAAAKKAHDDEYVERGCYKVGDDGESNHTRWLRASDELAKAMLEGVVVTSR
jgi:hypothetical protein